MKKLIVVGLVGAAIVGGVVLAKGAPAALTAEGRACTKMASLCGDEDKSLKDLDQCTENFKSMRKLAGDPSYERSMKCLDEATSCAAATGCIAGGVGVGAIGEALKGFGTALSK